jgi:hypothetical protein
MKAEDVCGELERLVVCTPAENNHYFQSNVCKIQRKEGNIIFVKPNSLYITTPCDCMQIPRIFLGCYLLSPGVVVPSMKEMKEEVEWLSTSGALVERKQPNWNKQYDAGDLYEDYLTSCLSRIKQYELDVDSYVEYGGELFKDTDFPLALIKSIFYSERERYKDLSDKVDEYKRKSSVVCEGIPHWMLQRVSRELLYQAELVRAINQFG